MPDTVAPIVPNAQENKGPELFLQSAKLGLEGFAKIAAARAEQKAAELNAQKLAQDAEQFDKVQTLDWAKLKQDGDLKNAALGNQYLTGEAAVMNAKARLNGLAGQAQKAQDKIDTMQGFQNDAKALDLYNSNPDNPVQFYASYQQLKDKYRFSPEKEIKSSLKEFEQITKDHTLDLTEGGVYDPESGIWKGGRSRKIPVGEIADAFNDPSRHGEVTDLLKRNGLWSDAPPPAPVVAKPGFLDQVKSVVKTGHTLPTQTAPQMNPPTTDINGQEIPGATNDPRVRQILQQSTGVKFHQAIPSSPAISTNDQSPPASSPFPETDSERLLRQGRAAMSRGAPRDQVAKMLQDRGIDPDELDSNAN